jgi:hypothetical protein
MRKLIIFIIAAAVLASCSNSAKLSHSHYTKDMTKGQDGCAWHK